MDKRVGVVSLGCDKNRVDTEYMLGFLQRGGFRLVQEPESAQVLIVNTCAFLEQSRRGDRHSARDGAVQAGGL